MDEQSGAELGGEPRSRGEATGQKDGNNRHDHRQLKQDESRLRIDAHHPVRPGMDLGPVTG